MSFTRSLACARRINAKRNSSWTVTPLSGAPAAATLLGLLGRYDCTGVDTEAISAVSKAFYGGPIGEKEVQAVFAKWGKYRDSARALCYNYPQNHCTFKKVQ